MADDLVLVALRRKLAVWESAGLTELADATKARIAELEGSTTAAGILSIEEVRAAESVEAEPAEEPQSEDDLADLRAQAEALGVKVDGRWGADRLRQEIEDAEEH
jgi:hypothetical protein